MTPNSPAQPGTLSNTLSGAGNLADQTAEQAEAALDKGQNLANHTLDQLRSGVSDLRTKAPAALSRAAAQVEDLGRRGIERAREGGAQVKHQVARASDRSVEYIRDEPVKAVLIAAATGVVFAAAMSWLTRSRRSGD